MLLAAGRTVYFGPMDGAVDYFKSTGHPAPLFVKCVIGAVVA